MSEVLHGMMRWIRGDVPARTDGTNHLVNNASVFLSSICILIGLLGYLIGAWVSEGVPGEIAAEVVPELRDSLYDFGGYHNPMPQRFSFLGWFSGLWAIVAATLFIPRVFGDILGSFRLRSVMKVCVSSPAIALLILFILWFWEVERGPSLVTPIPYWAFIGSVIFVLISGFFAGTRLFGIFSSVFFVMTAACVIYLMLGGFLFPAEMSSWGQASVDMVEVHYVMLMGAGERIAAGLFPYIDIPMFYGSLKSIISALLIKNGVSIDWGDYYRAVQVCQILMLLSMACIIWCFRDTKRFPYTDLFSATVIFLIISQYLYTSNYMNFFPNQTGWRYLNFSTLFLLVILLKNNKGNVRALIYGCISPFLILFNIETALAVIGGLIAHANVASLRFRTRSMLCVTSIFFGAFAAVFLVIGLASVASTDASLGSLSARFFAFMLRFNQGFGGAPFQDIDAVAVFIGMHVGLVLIGSAFSWSHGALNERKQMEFSVSVVISIWIAYYFNRPQTLNLWSHVYLYCALLPGVFRAAFSSPSLWRFVPTLRPVHLPIILVVAFSTQGVWKALETTRNRIASPVSPNAVEVSGVWFQASIAERMNTLAGFIRNHPMRDDLVYFTPHSFSMPLISGVYPPMPVRDPFWEAQTMARFNDLMARIGEAKPPIILFDDLGETPHELFGKKNVQRLYSRMVEELKVDYEIIGNESGWMVLKRK